MAVKPETKIVPLFGRGPRLEDEPEVSVATMRAPTAGEPVKPRAASAVDLSGKPKALFLIGPGGTGKTTLARWIGWQMAQGSRSALMAALDPQNRSLATWFTGVETPPSSDGAQSARWLRDLLKYVMDQKQSAMLDFGGGDTALARLVETAPDFASALSEAGVEPVAIYTLAPRQDDLVVLESLEALGFKPAATALVLNEGRVDSTLSRDEAFARVLRHSAFRGAVGRGAVPIWMPRLEPEVAQEIEGKRLQFGQARDGQVPTGAKFAPIGGFERSMVRRWLDRMDMEFAPIKTWLP
jgi:hypothetical protein